MHSQDSTSYIKNLERMSLAQLGSFPIFAQLLLRILLLVESMPRLMH